MAVVSCTGSYLIIAMDMQNYMGEDSPFGQWYVTTEIQWTPANLQFQVHGPSLLWNFFCLDWGQPAWDVRMSWGLGLGSTGLQRPCAHPSEVPPSATLPAMLLSPSLSPQAASLLALSQWKWNQWVSSLTGGIGQLPACGIPLPTPVVPR